MFQQHQGESLSEAWTRFKDLLQKVPHHGIDLWLQVQIFYDHVNPMTRQTINQSDGGKLRDRIAEESWALLEDLALYDNEMNKVTSSCEICGGPHDIQYCMENPNKPLLNMRPRITTNKEDEAKKKDGEKSTTTDCKGHETMDEIEDKVKSEEEVEEDTEKETEEEKEGNPEHFNTFPTMNELRLEPKRKPSNPKKNCNFVGRVRGLKVFVGNFTYECDFMVLENTTSVIDHYLGSVVFGMPFVEATGLVYNRERHSKFDGHKSQKEEQRRSH
ncbi:hypothetical protein Tco_1503828, partial [Tanacetum coccineum]